MVIYGVALLAFCFISGLFLGELLGRVLGIEANLGGITFWSAIYIPIVVAMAAKQNVFSALDAGGVALVAGFLAVFISFLLIPFLTKVGKK